MKKVVSSESLPIKLWLEDIESGALEQAKNIANLPFAFKHIAIMPDSHQGYGMPIGGVLATKGVVIPNAVGVDIGCGMCAVKTSIKELDIDTLKKIIGEIRKVIPVGNGKEGSHKESQDSDLMPNTDNFTHKDICLAEFQRAKSQIGTLGGGNHFIEIQKGSDGHIWIMVHSGSRNLGYKVAKYYNLLAYEMNTKWHSDVYLPKNKEDSLAFFPMSSQEGQDYLKEMNYCVDFALANRKLMMDKICNIFREIIDPLYEHDQEIGNIQFDEVINIAHNYATIENHFGQNVVVHRKGATLARENTIGIIPGSQGTKSYIVQGLGNPESFMSCSHGAGRKMSRTKARNELNLEDEINQLDNKGILHAIRNKKDLDEASGAYKPIETVMENQKDLVKILVELTPLAVIKG